MAADLRADHPAALSQPAALAQVRTLVTGLIPCDDLETSHRDNALAWLDDTTDIYRRIPPATPDPHLVAYFVLIDHDSGSVLLVDHRKAGLWLPTGGHVEPGEHPVTTVRREAREELEIEAAFSPATGPRPVFLTVTRTRSERDRHTDVSLWFVLAGSSGMALRPDPREFSSARWWTRSENVRADPAVFDPHLRRMLAKFDRLSAGAEC